LQALAAATHDASCFSAASATTLTPARTSTAAAAAAIIGAEPAEQQPCHTYGAAGIADDEDMNDATQFAARLQVASAHELEAARGLMHAGAALLELQEELHSVSQQQQQQEEEGLPLLPPPVLLVSAAEGLGAGAQPGAQQAALLQLGDAAPSSPPLLAQALLGRFDNLADDADDAARKSLMPPAAGVADACTDDGRAAGTAADAALRLLRKLHGQQAQALQQAQAAAMASDGTAASNALLQLVAQQQEAQQQLARACSALELAKAAAAADADADADAPARAGLFGGVMSPPRSPSTRRAAAAAAAARGNKQRGSLRRSGSTVTLGTLVTTPRATAAAAAHDSMATGALSTEQESAYVCDDGSPLRDSLKEDRLRQLLQQQQQQQLLLHNTAGCDAGCQTDAVLLLASSKAAGATTLDDSGDADAQQLVLLRGQLAKLQLQLTQSRTQAHVTEGLLLKQQQQQQHHAPPAAAAAVSARTPSPSGARSILAQAQANRPQLLPPGLFSPAREASSVARMQHAGSGPSPSSSSRLAAGTALLLTSQLRELQARCTAQGLTIRQLEDQVLRAEAQLRRGMLLGGARDAATCGSSVCSTPRSSGGLRGSGGSVGPMFSPQREGVVGPSVFSPRRPPLAPLGGGLPAAGAGGAAAGGSPLRRHVATPRVDYCPTTAADAFSAPVDHHTSSAPAVPSPKRAPVAGRRGGNGGAARLRIMALSRAARR
jgi:hypothetical protein